MKYILLLFVSASVVFTSCSNKRFVSMSASKKAVNTPGSSYSESTISKRIDFDSTEQYQRIPNSNFQGASGIGTGRSSGATYYAQRKLKKKPGEDSREDLASDPYFNQPEGTETAQENYPQDSLQDNYSGEFEEDVYFQEGNSDGELVKKTKNEPSEWAEEVEDYNKNPEQQSTSGKKESEDWSDWEEEETDVEHLPW